jgi:hypothetical protein
VAYRNHPQWQGPPPPSQELLRIQVQNLECNCVCFSHDGKSIISGWSDGKIRAFGPQSGQSIPKALKSTPPVLLALLRKRLLFLLLLLLPFLLLFFFFF